MNRDRSLDQALTPGRVFDVLVVGGGATGVGIAVDAAARGCSVCLLERDDFGQGTSSRSTKLVHGGVRYLKQGNIALVREALHERDVLRRNAPHLVHDLAFLIPCYQLTQLPFYGAGLKAYDLLAGRHSFGRSRLLPAGECGARVPGLQRDKLKGGVLYHDGQFDDARFLISLAHTADSLGAVLLNHAPVIALARDGTGRITGARFLDRESGREHSVGARVVVNAAGPFVDELRRLEDPAAPDVTTASQGIHLVVSREFLGDGTALMIPRTPDNRVLFAIPWHDRVVVGTTDTPIPRASADPQPLPAEVEFVLETANRYLSKPITRRDVLSSFAGIRPLMRPGRRSGSTAAISREHTVLVGPGGLVTVTGGKWTTYRRMASDALDIALATAGLPPRPCATQTLTLHGATTTPDTDPSLVVYGSDAPRVRALIAEPGGSEPMAPNMPLRAGEVRWAAREEMARTLEDVLSRRTRWLLLDARAASDAAAAVARVLAQELGRDAHWQHEQTTSFTALARRYLAASES